MCCGVTVRVGETEKVGVMLKVADGMLPPDYRTGLVFVLLLVLLAVRPTGILGSRARARLREF